MDIRKKTNSLKKRYGTDNPFDIAKYLGIKVIFEPLGSISDKQRGWKYTKKGLINSFV